MKPRRLLRLLSLLCVVVIQGCGEDGAGSAGKQAAPDFTINTFDGATFRLSDHKGSPVVINFFASWCTTCGIEVFDLEKVYKEYLDKNVTFAGVAVDDTEEKAKKYVDKYAITYPNGLDGDGTIKKAYGIHGLPFTFFIDKEGFVSYIHAGAVTKKLLKYELDRLL